MASATVEQYEAAIQHCERVFARNKARMWVLKTLRKHIGKGVAPAPDLLAACKAWLDHYDTFVRTPELGDEPGIAEMRAAVLAASEG
jgi:hypothetical protein